MEECWRWTSEGGGRVGDDHPVGAKKGISMVPWALTGTFRLFRGIYSARYLPTKQISTKGTRWLQRSQMGRCWLQITITAPELCSRKPLQLLIAPSWKIRPEFNSKDLKLWIPSEVCSKSQIPLLHAEGNEERQEFHPSREGGISPAGLRDVHIPS